MATIILETNTNNTHMVETLDTKVDTIMTDYWNISPLLTQRNIGDLNQIDMLKTCFTETKKKIYKCLMTEFCCSTGCCQYRKRSIYYNQNWYLWVVLLAVLVGIFIGFFHYFQKQKLLERRRQRFNCRRDSVLRNSQQRIMGQRLLIDSISNPDGAVGFDDVEVARFLRQYARSLRPHPGPSRNNPENIFEHFFSPTILQQNLQFATRRSQNSEAVTSIAGIEVIPAFNNGVEVAPPPSYETLVDTFKDQNQVSIPAEDPPPVYLEACKLIQDHVEIEIPSGEPPILAEIRETENLEQCVVDTENLGPSVQEGNPKEN